MAQGAPSAEDAEAPAALKTQVAGLKVDRTIVLVGMMGAGKSSVGRRLAQTLRLPFYDADCEIERAAGKSVSDIFAEHGEAEFRRGERQVLARLLREPPHVLATGGGAYMDPATRALLKETALTVWLTADLDVLMRRLERRDTRPLLRQPNPRAVVERILAERAPIYAEADVHVVSAPGPHWLTVEAVLAAIAPLFAEGAVKASRA